MIRDWSINTKRFSGENGKVKKLHGVRLEWQKGENGRMQMNEIPGSEFELDADLVLLALGFLGPERDGLVSDLGVELDERGNVKADSEYMSSVPGVFSCGDEQDSAGPRAGSRGPATKLSSDDPARVRPGAIRAQGVVPRQPERQAS